MWKMYLSSFDDRIEEIFYEMLLRGCNFTLTLSKCIRSPWWCWRRTSSSGRCASIWSPNSKNVLTLNYYLVLCFHHVHPCLWVCFIKNRNIQWHSTTEAVFGFRLKEEVFWKNYFYRVSLIKQSAELTALAAQQASERRGVDKSQKDLKGTIYCVV